MATWGTLGCSSGGELPEVDCETAEVVPFSEVAAFNKCTTCHSTSKTGGARNGAPGSLNFDVYASAADEATEIAEEVEKGKMPPKGYPAPTAEEKQQLYAWALCGAPE